jgi:hypothetical protein
MNIDIEYLRVCYLFVQMPIQIGPWRYISIAPATPKVENESPPARERVSHQQVTGVFRPAHS